MKELISKIERLKEKKALCRLYIVVGGIQKSIDGFILDSSRDFLLVQQCLDFEINGLIIIEKGKIEKIRYGKYEISFSKIMKAEKLLDEIYDYKKINLDNYSNVFKELKKQYKFIIVENVYDGKLDFCIGEIKRINKNSVSVLCFDATGKIDKTSTVIPFNDILNIEFESKYINIFKRHLRK